MSYALRALCVGTRNQGARNFLRNSNETRDDNAAVRPDFRPNKNRKHDDDDVDGERVVDARVTRQGRRGPLSRKV